MTRHNSKRGASARQKTSKACAQPPLPSSASRQKELLLVDEVTARARVSRWTVWRLEKAGRFPKPMKIGFKRIAWRAAEIDAWVAGNWVAPQAVAA